MSEVLVNYILLGLLIATNAFWAWQCHGLLNRLMSKDFGEYQYYKNPPKTESRPTETEAVDLEEINRENESYLSELNGMMLPK